jgi:hypothetical protein
MAFGGRFTGRFNGLLTLMSAMRLPHLCFLAGTLIPFSFGVAVVDVQAHAPSWSINTEARPLTIEYRYTDGSPMPFAKIKVMAVDGSVLQIGNSDRSGRFSFVPDDAPAGGPWTVIAVGDEGHEITATIAADAVSNIVNRRSGVSSSLIWLLVASVLTNIAVLCAYIERRWRRNASAKT